MPIASGVVNVPTNTIEFVKAALRNPREVSTIFPTSRFLAASLLENSGLSQASSVIELGAGTGAITRHLAPRLKINQSYLGVELDPKMADFLRHQYPGLRFESGPAEALNQWVEPGSIDTIVSSLPWSMFSDELQINTLSAITRSLKPGGVFVTYVCLNALWYPQGKEFVKRIPGSFGSVTRAELEWRNIPPAYVFKCVL